MVSQPLVEHVAHGLDLVFADLGSGEGNRSAIVGGHRHDSRPRLASTDSGARSATTIPAAYTARPIEKLVSASRVAECVISTSGHATNAATNARGHPTCGAAEGCDHHHQERHERDQPEHPLLRQEPRVLGVCLLVHDLRRTVLRRDADPDTEEHVIGELMEVVTNDQVAPDV